MAPADLQPSIQRIDALLTDNRYADNTKFEEPIRQLRCIRKVLVGLQSLIVSYGDVFDGEDAFDEPLTYYELYLINCSTQKRHSWGFKSRQNQAALIKVEEDVLFRIRVFIVKFALRCNAVLDDHSPSESSLKGIFNRLRSIKYSVESLRTPAVQGLRRPVELRKHASHLEVVWNQLCDETGLSHEDKLPVEEIVATSTSQFWAPAFRHATPQCMHKPIHVTSPVWERPLRGYSSDGPVASIILNRREYSLEQYRRSTTKPYTIVWSGKDDKGRLISLEHKLSEKLLPHTKHSTYGKDQLVMFPGEQDVTLKRDSVIRYSGPTEAEYNFVNVNYSKQFHEDLRGRKAVTTVDVKQISSADNSREAVKEKIYIWRDNQSDEAQLHTLSYYGSNVEHQEVEFPILWFNRKIHRISSTCLQLNFLLDQSEKEEEKRKEKDGKSKEHLRRSSSTSLASTIGSSIYVPQDYKAVLAKFQFLKISFELAAECNEFRQNFEAKHYDDCLVHLLYCLPAPDPTPLPVRQARAPPSQPSSLSTNSVRTGRSSEILPQSPSPSSSIEPGWIDRNAWYVGGISPAQITRPARRGSDGNPAKMFEIG